MSILVLATSVFLEAQASALRRLAPDEVVLTDPDADPVEDVEVLVAFRLVAGIVPRFPRLRFVASPGAGVDDLLAAGDIPPDVAVTRVRDPAQSARMAQYVALHVLRWHRQSSLYEAQQRDVRWQRHATEPEAAWTVGMMGLGEQGRAVARTLATMGYPLRAWTRTARNAPDVECFAGEPGLAPFLAGTRILVCAMPLTAATRGLVDRALLAKLAPGSYLVNVSRGGIVVESAVHDAIGGRRLAGAALDVFEQEPLPADSPLWRDGRIAVTPHVAATPDADTAARQILDNLARARRGEPLHHLVDRGRGY